MDQKNKNVIVCVLIEILWGNCIVLRKSNPKLTLFWIKLNLKTMSSAFHHWVNLDLSSIINHYVQKTILNEDGRSALLIINY